PDADGQQLPPTPCFEGLVVSFPSACWMLTLRVGAEMVECLLLRAGLQPRVSKWPRNARRVSQGSAAPRFPSSGRMRSPVTTIGGRSPVDGARRSRDIWDVSRSSASSGSSAGGSSSSSSSGRNPVRIAARAITSCFGSHDGGLPPSADDSEDLKPPSPQLDDGTVVAVKRAKKVFGNTHNSHLNAEFQNEIQTLARIEHLNLVRLHGYLEHQDERIVIVEYVSNGTLREHLDCKFLMLNFPLCERLFPLLTFYDFLMLEVGALLTYVLSKNSGQRGQILDLAARLDIAIDVAHAVTYLHMYSDNPIIHRDIKSSNILLTDNLRAKVADFGFARLFVTDSDVTHVSTQVKGTAGYLDPEYLRTYQLTEKSDVYSFGVLLVELVSGRRPIEPRREPNERLTPKWV
ncbi:hypothetical protein BHE74_00018230, partial [Ensete ventricosum]